MTKNKSPIGQQLGRKLLLRITVLAALIGAALAILQVTVNASNASNSLNERASGLFGLVEQSALLAVQKGDAVLATSSVAGLLNQPDVIQVLLKQSNGTRLTDFQRPPVDIWYRSLTDRIFGHERVFSHHIRSNPSVENPDGIVLLTLDTLPTARQWLYTSSLVIVSSMSRAIIIGLLLYLLFHYLVYRPIISIIRNLPEVDPDNPERALLKAPAGHERDELGLLVDRTNQLLTTISEHERQRQQVEERAKRLTQYDQLTGLASRETLLGLLISAIADGRKNRRKMAVHCCGIDEFKNINDQYGYGTGDQVLQVVAERLSDINNGHNLICARLGSDQFVLVERDLTGSYQAAATAEWLLETIARPVRIGKRDIHLTGTIGISLFPDDSEFPDRLLQRAEQTMNLAKAAGHNHFQFYVASLDTEIRERKQLERDLSEALRNNQLFLLYQPQISFATNRVIGVEALLRWHHPERGLIPPDHFIPLAEHNGSIIQIGAWVLAEACRQAAAWEEAGYSLRMAVNLSAVQLRQADLLTTVLDLLERYKIKPGKLELEVTETSFMENLETAARKLEELRNLGVSIAVDDFGTGYSSLTYLKRMPVEQLKIDKQFVHDLLANDDDTRIANTIIDLGRSLNLSVIAEGVETEEQAAYLKTRGCQIGQGYYFSKPLAPDRLRHFVDQFNENSRAAQSLGALESTPVMPDSSTKH